MSTATLSTILRRELQQRSRSGATFAFRVIAGLVSLVICLQQLLLTAPLRTPAAVGRSVFNALIAAAFVLGCSACLIPANAITTERRDGTLGLLLLTHVRGLEVLLGKLASSGLTSLCAVIAFLPALMLPLLAGGVSGFEVARKGVALIATLWFALTAGLCGAAAQGPRIKAGRGAALVTLFFVLIPFLCLAVRPAGPMQYVGLLSPLALTMVSGDSVYSTSPNLFWISLALVFALGWVLLLASGWLLPRAVLKDTAFVRERSAKEIKETKRAIGVGKWQPDKNDSEPVEWLIYRDGLGATSWLIAVLGLTCSRWTALFMQAPRGSGVTVFWLLAWPLGMGAAVLGGWVVALVAGRFFAAARRTGELELLLTTPVGAHTVLSDQWSVLKRLFLWPVLGMQAAFLLPVWAVVGAQSSLPGSLLLSAALNLLNSALGTAALCWLGMRYALRARSQTIAILWAVSLSQGLPWLITLSIGMLPLLPDLFLMIFYGCLLAVTRDGLAKDLTPDALLPLRLRLRDSSSS